MTATAIGRRAGDGCALSAFAHHCPLKLGAARAGPTALRPSSTVASRPCLLPSRHVSIFGVLVMYINATDTTFAPICAEN